MKINIVDENNKIQNIDVVFAFNCQENLKHYIAVDNHDDIFEPMSRYSNLDILEIVKTKGKYVYVADVAEEDWNTVKKALQFKVFSNLG